MGKNRYRKRMFVDREVQGTIIWRFMSQWMFTGLAAFTYLFILEVLASREPMSFSGYLAQLWDQYGMLSIVFLTVFPIFAYDVLRMSHRFAGPMVSVRRALKQLAHGESITHLRLRESDFWQEIADDVEAKEDSNTPIATSVS